MKDSDIQRLVEKLIEDLGSVYDYEPAERAVEKLAEIGEPAVPALINALEDETARMGSIEALGKIGEPAIPYLINTLKDEDVFARRRGARALGNIAKNHPEYDWKEAILALINDALNDNDEGVRELAAEALGKIGEPAVPALIDVLKDKDEGLLWATMALSEIGDARAVPALIDALKIDDHGVRWYAAEGLKNSGVNEEQLKMIIQMLKEGKTSEEKYGPVLALEKIGDARAVPALVDTLKDKNLRSSAASALDEIGIDIIPELKDKMLALLLIPDKKDEIVEIGKSAVPYLIEALNDEHVFVRMRAAEALGEIAEKGIDISSAIPLLIEGLKDEHRHMREHAGGALGKIVEKIINEGEYPTALKIVKDQVINIRKTPKNQERKKVLGKLAELTQKIHDKMTSDKKEFHKTVKHQSVRRTQVRKVIRSG